MDITGTPRRLGAEPFTQLAAKGLWACKFLAFPVRGD
jgi:hypothetical protein